MRKSVKILPAIVVLFGAAAGISYATNAVTRTATSVLQACANSTNGNLRLVTSAGDCRTNESAVSWNVVGQTGPQGPAGPAGKDGTDGTNGTNGTNGADGVSPTVQQLAANDPNCPAGGASITDAAGHVAYVCNGVAGAPFSGTFASPNNLFSLRVADTGIELRGPQSRVTLDPTSLDLRADTNLTVRSGLNLQLDSSGTATLRAAALTLGEGSCAPALRITDSMLVNLPAQPAGSYPVTIVSPGSTDVCIG